MCPKWSHEASPGPPKARNNNFAGLFFRGFLLFLPKTRTYFAALATPISTEKNEFSYPYKKLKDALFPAARRPRLKPYKMAGGIVKTEKVTAARKEILSWETKRDAATAAASNGHLNTVKYLYPEIVFREYESDDEEAELPFQGGTFKAA
ncbi:hypothetical protein PI125_g25727 [Phytophthora idaei]|nr:hypothetical protein PI125_g25727 [Phytophthora idaei]